MPPPTILSDQSKVVNEQDEEGNEESTMELDRPGEEKKKRWDAKAAVRSGVGAVSRSEKEDEEREFDNGCSR